MGEPYGTEAKQQAAGAPAISGHQGFGDRDEARRGALRQGYVMFDQAQRVMHASGGVRAVLRLSEEARVLGEGMLQLLAQAVGEEPETMEAARRWLDGAEQRQDTAQPLMLLTKSAARTVQASLSRVAEQYWIADFSDVTAELEAESAMAAIAYQDRLTGIGNRAHFEHRLDRALTRVAADESEGVTIFFLDLDRFKVVNDTLGHSVGDALLRTVSERLASTLRDEDTLSRLGGDEFAILLSHTGGKDVATTLAARIIDLIQRPYLIEGQVVNVGASIGIASSPADGASREELLKCADLALYHSKAMGRGVFHFFEPMMAERAQQRRLLELDLRKALVLRQFELHYQPQIDVESQRVIGLEGLLRWRHPQRGLVLPGDFLSLAEEIGLAAPIGNWMLKTACKEATRWPDGVTIAVNISSLHFETATFERSVEQALQAAGLPGQRLEIEVTEDILLRDGQMILETLEALRALGVRVAMDSFGTGMASLSQLVNFPFDKIKIDSSLVAREQGDGRHRAIVRAISALGQSLGISTLAEGVETAEHLTDVRQDGCQTMQGFYYSRAVPSGELAGFFSNLSNGDGIARLQDGAKE